MSTPAVSPEQVPLARWQRDALIFGACGLVGCLIAGLIPDTRVHLFRAWLVAFNFCLGLALGGLVVVQLQYLTGGSWGFVLRRPLEAATRTLPLLALLFVPLLFGLGDLYEWARPEAVAADEALQHKAPYFYFPGAEFREGVAGPFPWFFLFRAALYFAIWYILQALLSSWSKRHDETGDPQWIDKCMALSAAGLMLYALTITFASIDWVMSLEPHWYSTIYGAMFGMGQVLSGFAFAIAVFLLLADRPPLDQAASKGNLRDLGSLLLAFVMVWAYLSLDQFLLIWQANLPEETPWYIHRITGPWRFVALALVLLMFAAPFVLLLSADLKRNRKGLAAVALLILVMRFFDLLWLIVPAFTGGHGHGSEGEEHGSALLAVPVYVAALAGIGGVWLGFFLWQLQRRPLLAIHPPQEEAVHGHAAHH
jgi:hypothetical protein